MDMKRYKFQALVTPAAAQDGDTHAKLGSEPCRMVLKAKNDETKHSQVFSALVDPEDQPFRKGHPEVMVTLRVVGDDDLDDYLDIGSHFSLWCGGNVGEGVVTRRLFI